MKITFLSVLLSLLCFVPNTGFGQEAAAKENVSKALAKLNTEDVSFVGGLVEEEPQTEQAGIAGVQRMVVMSLNGPSEGTEFRGDFDLLVTHNGGVCLVSKDIFPGLKIWKSGDDLVCVQAHGEFAFKTKSLVSMISQLVNWKALGEAIDGASKPRITTKEGETTVRVVLDTSFIPVWSLQSELNKELGGLGVKGKAANFNPLQPVILDLSAKIVLDSKQQLKSIEYEIQFNDPLKTMMSGGIIGPNGINVQGNGQKGDKAIQELGKLLIVSFDRVEKPSEKVVSFLKDAKEYTNK